MSEERDDNGDISSDTQQEAIEAPVVYMRWNVDTSVIAFCQEEFYSTTFRFQKHEWRLKFSYKYNEVDGYKHKYFLDILRPGGSSQFVASVHVVDCETGRIRPQLSQTTSIPGNIGIVSTYNSIWSMFEVDVQRVARIDRSYHKLRFLVVLKKDDILTDIDSKETQTQCYLPEVVGQGCSTTSTSVQTSLLHSATPCLESLSEDLAQLLVQDSDPDMEFLCGGQSTRAHKSIVCSRSPVIARMMTSDMVEGRTGVVTIPNMEPEVFKTFLGYLYSGKLEELSFDAALTLYGIGGQYAVRSLSKRCLQYLMEHLSVDNACEVLAAVDAHGDSEIVENVIEYILENKIPVVNDRWSAFCDDHPKLAIKVLSHFYALSLK